MEEEDQPLSPSLLEEEEEQGVVEESEEEEEEVVAGTPPPNSRLEELVPTSPVILTQRRVLRRRRGLGSEAGLASASQQLQTGAMEGGSSISQSEEQGIQDHPLLDEAGGQGESTTGTVQNAHIVHGLQETNDVTSGEPRLIDAEEVPINGGTSVPEEDASKVQGGDDQEKASTSTGKKAEARLRKKRKRVSEDEGEGSNCTICFEAWGNSGSHRIASLKCGHFFGQSCIEKWLRGASSCPNCNEKAARKDVRPHYVARLAALDTGERDRALAELEKTKVELRELQLRETELQVRLQQQAALIARLGGGQGQADMNSRPFGGSLVPTQKLQRADSSKGEGRLMYQRRHELCKPSTDRDKCCRVLAHSAHLGMLLVSQPNNTTGNLFPGFGVRRFNMLDQRLGNYVPVMKDVMRDLVVHPENQELLLSCGQDKTARITNLSSCMEVAKFTSESELWACAWGPGGAVYLGTKRSQVEVRSMREHLAEPTVISFQGTERRPIIGLRSVPASPENGLHNPGILVLTLGSLWYWELGSEVVQHRLSTPSGRLFSSLSYDPKSRLLLVSCRPAPTALHIVMQLAVSRLPGGSRVVVGQVVAQVAGGSYRERSFLRAALVEGAREGQVLLVYGRGSGVTDTKLVVKEVGTERTLQEVLIGKPVLDIQSAEINGSRYLAALGETDLTMYKWE